MSLDALVRLRLGDLDLDAHLRAAPGELVVLVGPNGAGKTTLLRTLAGLQPIDEGRIELDGAVMDDGRSAWTPPHLRGVGLVLQADYLLPHLTAEQNVGLAIREGTARDWLRRVGLEDASRLRPAQLSGGQAKRVALARALAVRPRMLLLDEPLAALDAAAHREIRRELRTYLASHDGVQVLVTHEPLDALTLADRIVVLEKGRIVQDALPEEIRARPRSAYVAEFVGLNLFAGTAHGGSVVTGSGAEIVAAASPVAAGPATAVIHPRAVALHLQPPEGTPRNTWRLTVRDVDDEHEVARVRLDGPLPLVAEVTSASVRALGLRSGTSVFATVKATEVTVYPS